jgi:uncharacterized protein (TIGR02145 family)
MKSYKDIFILVSVVFLMIILIAFGCKKIKKPATIADADGNDYLIVTIDNQVWMAENLRTTKYNDSAFISNLVTDKDWNGSSTPAYCWYDNDPAANKLSYGGLYNIYAVTTGKLCPTGWHVPNDADWTTLINYLGGGNTALGKLMETGSKYWGKNTLANNESGFTGLPGGYRWAGFNNLGGAAFWWSSTVGDTYSTKTSHFELTDSALLTKFPIGSFGYSVRCLKN